MSRILELDGLRAVAILLVLGHHYPGFARQWFRIPEFGWTGVGIFFALSGYLITTMLLGLRGRRSRYRTFYSRRMIRILPPYLATTLFLVLIAFHEHLLSTHLIAEQVFFLQGQAQDRALLLPLLQHPASHLPHLSALLANAHVLPQAESGYLTSYAGIPVTYWSLSIEEYFYLLWAPIVLRCSRRTIVSIAMVVCVAEIFLRWMNGTLFCYFSLLCRFDSLLYGALLAILVEHWRRQGTPAWAPRLFASVFALAVMLLTGIAFAVRPILGREIRDSVLFLVFGYALLSIGVSAFIGLLVLNTGSSKWYTRILRVRVLLFIGTISYTMYLIHLIAAVIVLRALSIENWHPSAICSAVTASILTMGIAYASWHWLEKPLLRWKDRRFPNIPHPAEPALG